MDRINEYYKDNNKELHQHKEHKHNINQQEVTDQIAHQILIVGREMEKIINKCLGNQ